MNTTTAPFALPDSAPSAARRVLTLLRRLQVGTLELQCPDGSQLHFGQPSPGAPRAALRIKHWDVCAAVMKSGDVGFGEATWNVRCYRRGLVHVPTQDGRVAIVLRIGADGRVARVEEYPARRAVRCASTSLPTVSPSP